MSIYQGLKCAHRKKTFSSNGKLYSICKSNDQEIFSRFQSLSSAYTHRRKHIEHRWTIFKKRRRRHIIYQNLHYFKVYSSDTISLIHSIVLSSSRSAAPNVFRYKSIRMQITNAYQEDEKVLWAQLSFGIRFEEEVNKCNYVNWARRTGFFNICRTRKHNESTTAASGAFNFSIHIIMHAFKFQNKNINFCKNHTRLCSHIHTFQIKYSRLEVPCNMIRSFFCFSYTIYCSLGLLYWMPQTQQYATQNMKFPFTSRQFNHFACCIRTVHGWLDEILFEHVRLHHPYTFIIWKYCSWVLLLLCVVSVWFVTCTHRVLLLSFFLIVHVYR